MEQKLSQRGTMIYFTMSSQQGSPEIRSSNPTVVFIHNMWGNHRILHRHVKLFSELGYKCATFNLYKASTIKDCHPFGFFQKFKSMHQLWVEQAEDVLNSVEGKKIIFAMSGPSIAGIIAGSQRTDITHLICDSGPFKEVWACTYRLLTQIWHIPTPPLRAVFTTWSVLMWGVTAFRRSQNALRHWNKNVPIFSIRGALDPLVYPENVNGIFKDHTHLSIKVWTIEKGHHLDGLKLFPEIYKQQIVSFLGIKN